MIGRMTAGLVALAAASAAAAVKPVEPVSLTWIGGPTMLIKFGPIEILTDPVLGEGEEAFRVYDPNVGKPDVPQARLNPLPSIDLDGVDLLLVSHSHEDHLDRTAIARLGGKQELLLPASQVEQVRKRGATQARGIGWGGTWALSDRGYEVRITAVAARHSTKAELLPILGEVNGYWLEFRRGGYRRTVYWSGDSFAPAGDVPANLKQPDLFIPHLGAVGEKGPIGHVSMGATHAVDFARQLRPRAVLPIHHSTFSLYREPIDRFYDSASRAGLNVERLSEGQRTHLK